MQAAVAAFRADEAGRAGDVIAIKLADLSHVLSGTAVPTKAAANLTAGRPATAGSSRTASRPSAPLATVCASSVVAL